MIAVECQVHNKVLAGGDVCPLRFPTPFIFPPSTLLLHASYCIPVTPYIMRSWALLASVVLPLVAAQSSSDTNIGLSAIKAHFNQSRIVPDFLSTFEPKALLDINYGTFTLIIQNRKNVQLNVATGAGNIQPGQLFTKERALSLPYLPHI